MTDTPDYSHLRSGANNDPDDAVFGEAARNGGITPSQAVRIASGIIEEQNRYGVASVEDNGVVPNVPRRNRHLDGYGRP